jgi:hypothetical protein
MCGWHRNKHTEDYFVISTVAPTGVLPAILCIHVHSHVSDRDGLKAG